MNVNELMTKDPACCTPDANVQEAARLMKEHDCGCIPVIEDRNSKKPVGVITDRDICCRTVAEGKNPLDLTVQEVMTSNVETVTEDTSVEECCTLMEDKQIRRVVVVDGNGGCCGIVAQADIALQASENKTAEVVQEVSKTTSSGATA